MKTDKEIKEIIKQGLEEYAKAETKSENTDVVFSKEHEQKMQAIFDNARKEIKSKYIKSLLFYLPYAVLSAMTIPAIFYSTGNLTTAIVGTIVAVVVAFFDNPLIIVALSAAISALITGLII